MHREFNPTRRREVGVVHLSRPERDRVVDTESEWAETQPVFYLGDEVVSDAFARPCFEPASRHVALAFKPQ